MISGGAYFSPKIAIEGWISLFSGTLFEQWVECSGEIMESWDAKMQRSLKDSQRENLNFNPL
jgi:hypothetical protein